MSLFGSSLVHDAFPVDYRDLMVAKEIKEMMEILVRLDLQDQQEPLGSLVAKEILDQLVVKDLPDPVDQM